MLATATIDEEADNAPPNLGRDSQMMKKGETPAMTEEEIEEQEKRFKMNRMQQQMQRPIVFGLTEDVKYGQHKIPVKHFIENRNNK